MNTLTFCGREQEVCEFVTLSLSCLWEVLFFLICDFLNWPIAYREMEAIYQNYGYNMLLSVRVKATGGVFNHFSNALPIFGQVVLRQWHHAGNL